MGKRNQPLSVTLYVGGKQVDTLTEEQRQRLADRLSEVMSNYFTAHPDEYLKLINSLENEK